MPRTKTEDDAAGLNVQLCWLSQPCAQDRYCLKVSLLREMHLPNWTNSRANSYLKTGIHLFQQVLQVRNSPNSPKNPRQNLLLPPILPNLGLFGPGSVKWIETLNAYLTLFHGPNSKLAVIAVTLLFSHDWWKAMCTPLHTFQAMFNMTAVPWGVV